MYCTNFCFRGTSGIDIDLQKVDIDQCPTPPESKEYNVFAATDKCKETTKVINIYLFYLCTVTVSLFLFKTC